MDLQSPTPSGIRWPTLIAINLALGNGLTLVTTMPALSQTEAVRSSSRTTTERHYAKWLKGKQDRLDMLVSATWAK